MTKTRLIRVALAALLFHAAVLPVISNAAISLTFKNGAAGPSSVSVAPGGTFTFDVYITATSAASIIADEYYFQASGLAGSAGYFSITNRVYDTTFVQDANFPTVNGSINPRNTISLGGTTDTTLNVTNGNQYHLALYTISVSPSATAGVFTITSVDTAAGGGAGIWTDSGFGENQFSPGGTFTVTVVPEPSTYLLLLGGLAFLLVAVKMNRRSGQIGHSKQQKHQLTPLDETTPYTNMNMLGKRLSNALPFNPMTKSILSSSLAVLALASTSFAAQLDWAPLAPTPPYGGAGTWQDGGATSWKNGGGISVSWNNANLDLAKFEFGPGTPTTVTVGLGGVTASEIMFGSNGTGGYNITGGLITLTGNGQNLIEGNGFSGANTITSNITSAVGDGRIKTYLGTTSTLNVNGGVALTGGGTKNLYFDNETVGNIINVNGAITAPAATLTVLVGNENGASDAVYNFSGTNTGLDSTADKFQVDRGTVQIGNAAALGSASVIVGQSVSGTQRASLKTTAPMTISNPIQITGPSGTGTYVLGSTVAGTTTFSGSVVLNRDVTLETIAGTSLVFSGAVSNAAGVIKNGAGTVTFTSATGNTYTGDTTVNAGKLLFDIGVDYALRSRFTVESGATFGGNGHMNNFTGTALVKTGGILQSGNGVDATSSLRIDGSLTLQNGAHIAMVLGPSQDSSALFKSFGGSVWTLGDNLVFDFTVLPGTTIGTFQDILDLPGFSGTPNYASWTSSNPAVIGTFVNDGAGHVDFVASAVPEPATTLLVGLGLGSVLLLRRRNSANKS